MQSIAAFSAPLAVIAPGVPVIYQVLGPLLLMVAPAILLAIPRCFLVFAHWLWLRVAPRSLVCRSIPGVRSRVFEGVAARQFVDEYAFSVPDGAGDLRSHVVTFFEQRGAKAQDDQRGLTFARGGRFRSYVLAHIIPCRERDFLQRIHIEFRRKLENKIEVFIRYTVHTFCMLRVQPAGLQDEVRALHRLLTAEAAA